MDKKFETYVFSTIYNLRDLNGNLVPDSKITRSFRDMTFSNGDYKRDCSMGVNAYTYHTEKIMPLANVDLDKYVVKYIAGLWRYRKKPSVSYTVTQVYDQRLILGKPIKIKERDPFNFKYYVAAKENYDLFGVLEPKFNMFVAKCNTKNGIRMRYGATREGARAFLRGALFDEFGPEFADVIFGTKRKRSR